MRADSAIEECTRRVIVFVAWRLITGDEGFDLYDHDAARRLRYSGTVSETRIDLCDEDGCRISGAGGLGFYTLTPRDRAKPVSLKISGLAFEGFDYGSGRRYRGALDREQVSLDEGPGDKAYAFSVSQS